MRVCRLPECNVDLDRGEGVDGFCCDAHLWRFHHNPPHPKDPRQQELALRLQFEHKPATGYQGNR